MPWLRTSTQQRIATGNRRRHFRHSMELPIAVSARGMSAPIYAVLIDLSATGCRVRSLILLDRERVIEFKLQRAGYPALPLLGRIVSRTTPTSGAAFEYGVAFEELTARDVEQLNREVSELQRRAAAARAQEAQANRTPQDRSQRRKAVRAMTSFPLRFRCEGRASIIGQATDVGAGGLRLACTENFTIGTELELRFTLPSDVLKAYPPSGARLDITPFGPRRIRIPDNRRPFDEMFARGRIAAQFPPSKGRAVYGVEFTDIDGYTREEIARFTHAVQLSKLRAP